MDLDDVKARGAQLSPWAHMATVGADGNPDVVPVHPCWEGDVLWVMVGTGSWKRGHTAVNPRAARHRRVPEKGGGVEVWGTAVLHHDLGVKRRLWKGVLDYDLDAFAPGGPENSPEIGFMAITPQRALWLGAYGMAGSERWQA